MGGGVPGLRPEGPSGANIHKFPHHGLYSTTGGGKPKASNKAPYNDKDSDLSVGDMAAEEEPEVEELPEMNLGEFFKFTTSASDNTSFHRPPTYGSGAPRAYGKSSKEYGAYDPSADDEDSEEENKRRQETMAGRAHQKVGIYENPQMRSREPRDDQDYVTKQPFSSGMPGWDKKDIVNGDAKIDELMKELEDDGSGKIYEAFLALLEGEKEFEYLKKINMKTLQKQQGKGRPPEGVDPRAYYQQLTQELNQQALEGPVFDSSVLNFLKALPLELDKAETQWLANNYQNYKEVKPTPEVLKSLFTWTRNQNVDLKKFPNMSLDDLYAQAQQASQVEDIGDYKTNDVVMKLPNGYKIVQVGKEDSPKEDVKSDLETEGEKMGHCVGSYCQQVFDGDSFIYSLRDSKNNPHATIELDDSNTIVQIQGKENREPIEKYHSYIWEFIKDFEGEEKLAYAPAEELQKSMGDIKVRRFLAGSSKTSPEALMKLAEDEDEMVLDNLAENPNTPPEVLAKLEEDEIALDQLVRNPNTPPEVLAKLSNKEDIEILGLVAKNPNTPPEVLIKFANHEESFLREKVAKNPNTPPEVLIKLAEDGLWTIQEGVAKNPNAPPEALLKVIENADSVMILEIVARNPNAPSEVLMKLAEDSRADVRMLVAENPNTPPEVLIKLAEDEDLLVREEVVKNPNSPQEALQKLINDEDSWIRKTAGKKLNQSESLSLIDFFKEAHRDMGWSDTAYSRMNHTKKSQNPKSDLSFWDIIGKDNIYLMTNPDKEEHEEKEEE